MKWRRSDEKPKLDGYYNVVTKHERDTSCNLSYDFHFFDGEKFIDSDILAWLDPEIPEEFLPKPKQKVRKCPYCSSLITYDEKTKD